MISWILIPAVVYFFAYTLSTPQKRTENSKVALAVALFAGIGVGSFIFTIPGLASTDSISGSYSLTKFGDGEFVTVNDSGGYTVITSDGAVNLSGVKFSTNVSPNYAGQDVALLLKHDWRGSKAWSFWGVKDTYEIVLPQGGPIKYRGNSLTD